MSEPIADRIINQLRDENRTLAAEVVRLVRLTDAMEANILEKQRVIDLICQDNARRLREMQVACGLPVNEGWSEIAQCAE